MPFGLRNAGPFFQRHVVRAIRDCQAAFAWFDDIVICSRNHEDHVIHVRQVLQFLPSIARKLQPLTDALRGGRKGADKLEWSVAMDAAFAGAKQALLTATHLAHPTGGAELSVVVDASATHVGACLQQQLPGRKEWQPLGFFSKKLETAQQKYSVFDREFFACYAGIRNFRYMLDGSRFAIFTDHKPPHLCLGKGF